MGWCFYGANHFKNGKIDRKKECEDLIGKSLVKGSLVGTTYYAAVRNREDVIGLVILTSVDGYDFGYKDMSEDMGPYKYECPKSILKLLTPTDNTWAKLWRKRCIERQNQKKELAKLPFGTRIVLNGWEERSEKSYVKTQCGRKTLWLRSIYVVRESTILDSGYKIVDDEYFAHEKEVDGILEKYAKDGNSETLQKAFEKKEEYKLKDAWFSEALEYWNRFFGKAA